MRPVSPILRLTGRLYCYQCFTLKLQDVHISNIIKARQNQRASLRSISRCQSFSPMVNTCTTPLQPISLTHFTGRLNPV